MAAEPEPSTSEAERPEHAAARDGAPLAPIGELFRLPAQGLVFEELERELVRQALERTSGNQTRAAKLLGMTRDQMRYRIQKFALGNATLPGSSQP